MNEDLTSTRDLEVFRLVATGTAKPAIHKLLNTTDDGIRASLSRITRAFHAESTAHAVAIAHVKGYLTSDHEGPPIPPLDKDPRNVLVYIARGKSYKDMVNDLGLTQYEIRRNLAVCNKQLQTTDRPNLVHRGFLTGNLVLKRKPEDKEWTTKSPPPDSGDGSVPPSASCS